MTPSTFISWVEKNAARVKQYKNGGDGTGGNCDCIGLVIGAWRLSGNKWPWTHGSNYTARYLVNNLAAGRQLAAGDLVFKAREPGAAKYSLPDTYKGHPDQRDYYHVGVVISASPLKIKHCTSVAGGIKVDTARGEWKYSAQFKYIEGDDTPMSTKTATVYAENGGKVNLRQGPGTKYAMINRIASGTQVDVLSVSDGWAIVRHGDWAGYMSTDFLVMHEETAAQNTADGDLADYSAAMTDALSALDEAEKAINAARATIHALLETTSAVG